MHTAGARAADAPGGLLTVRTEERAAAGPAGGQTVAHQVTNLAAVVIPFATFVLAAVLLWDRLVEWIDLAALAVAYAATCLGITPGFHRLLTHRSFQTYPPSAKR